MEETDVVCYELLQLLHTISVECYKQVLINMKETFKQKRPKYAERHHKVFFQLNNVHQLRSKPDKEILQALSLNTLVYALCLPDLDFSTYLFRSCRTRIPENSSLLLQKSKLT